MLLVTLVVLTMLSFGDITVIGTDTSEDVGFTEESDTTGHDYGTPHEVNTTDDYESEGSIAEEDSVSSEEYDDYINSEEYNDYNSSEESIEDDVDSEGSAEYWNLMKHIMKSCFPTGFKIPGFPFPSGGGSFGGGFGGSFGGSVGSPTAQQQQQPKSQKTQSERLSRMTAATPACSDYPKIFWREFRKMVKSGEVQRCGRQKCSFSDVMKVRSVVPMSPECQEQGIMFYKGEM